MDISIVRICALLTPRRGRTVHDRLLQRLDRSVATARQLCDRAQDQFPDDQDGAIADAFQTTLVRPARDWLRRAEAVVATVRTGSDTICGARANELRVLIDRANVAMMRQPTGREAWRNFYRAVMALEIPAQKSGN
jgi:hypothetical protein